MTYNCAEVYIGRRQQNLEVDPVLLHTAPAQGRDKDVIIYSGTKSQMPTERRDLFSGDILEDRRRLNVAVTRAKRKLIIICDTTTLEKNNPFKEMFKYFRGPQLVNLSDPKLKIEFKGLLEENETKINL